MKPKRYTTKKAIEEYSGEVEFFKDLKKNGIVEVDISTISSFERGSTISIDQAINHWQKQLDELNQRTEKYADEYNY